MNSKSFHTAQGCKKVIEFTREERSLLNAVIDLIIPSDEHFPPPSSLQLTDELLRHLQPHIASHLNLMLSCEHLRTMLHKLNIAAEGHFCALNTEKQQVLLSNLEQQDPATFQALWTLVNHSYYSHLALRAPISIS